MKILKNELKNELKIRVEQDFPIDGIEFIDITPLIMDKDLFQEIINKFLEDIKNKNLELDYILAPEARGFVLGSVIAKELGIGFIPVRKKGKLPPSVVEAEIEYVKEYGKDYLELPKLYKDKYEGKKIYIIDDIYATGNTIKAIKEKVQNIGGQVIGEGVIINIKELNDNKEIYSILDVEEDI